jgi:hypothetical protein
MENMSDTIPVSVGMEAGSSKDVDPAVETTADLTCIVTDQSRVENEEIDFEVRNESFACSNSITVMIGKRGTTLVD